MKSVYQADYYEYRKNYKQLCLSFGFIYEESFDFLEEGREEFEKNLDNLK